MKTSDISILGLAEKLTLMSYYGLKESSPLIAELVGRVAAIVFLSIAAAGDILLHGLLLLPTFVYALGKSICYCNVDLTLPWQHLQRIRNAVTPVLFGSLFGFIHPVAGIVLSEPTDKHAMLGMLSSNTDQHLETPCSPIHSLSIIEDIATSHQYKEIDGQKKMIFSDEQIQAIRDAKDYEKSLESLQAQEFIHKITNTTLYVLGIIALGVVKMDWSDCTKHIVIALSGLLIPVLTAVDVTIALIAQTFFLITGITRWITGRGPIYTEVTTNPFMHLAFLLQNILKGVGNIVGTFIWPVSQETAFKISLTPGILFFKMQMKMLMHSIKNRMESAKDNSRFVLPILYYTESECSVLSIPSHTQHKTYLIVEKKGAAFNLYWVNRPHVPHQKDMDFDTALEQIQSMLDERFPFMDMEKMLAYPVKAKKPDFVSDSFVNLDHQGNDTNCVVTNLFGMLETLGVINQEDFEITRLRYQVTREALMKDYSFYKYDVYPFDYSSSMKGIWKQIKQYPAAAI